eukprot:5891545-Amphidinium_carterae.1
MVVLSGCCGSKLLSSSTSVPSSFSLSLLNSSCECNFLSIWARLCFQCFIASAWGCSAPNCRPQRFARRNLLVRYQDHVVAKGVMVAIPALGNLYFAQVHLARKLLQG